VVAGLVEGGHTTLGFTRSRRGAEMVADDVRRRLPSPLAGRVRAYRGGFLADEPTHGLQLFSRVDEQRIVRRTRLGFAQ
jgi:hypothetical protein